MGIKTQRREGESEDGRKTSNHCEYVWVNVGLGETSVNVLAMVADDTIEWESDALYNNGRFIHILALLLLYCVHTSIMAFYNRKSQNLKKRS